MMNFLRLFGSRKTQLAVEDEASAGGPEGQELLSYQGSHDFPPYVRKVIGDFNPKAVSMDTRLLMRYSPDVAFMSALVRAPIVNMTWTIGGEDPEICAGLDAMIRPKYPMLSNGGSLAPLLGFQVIQPVYEAGPFEFKVEDKTKGTAKTVTIPLAWAPRRYKAIDPRTITLKANPRTDEFESVEQDQDGRTVRVAADQVVLWTHGLEDEFGRLTGFGIYDTAYTPWYSQSGLILLRNNYFERKADPTPVGYFQEGQGTEDKTGAKKTMRELMGAALAAIRARSYVLVPGRRDDKGNRLNEITYLADDKRGDMFQQAIDSDGVRILKCGLIPGDSAQGAAEGGSRARAEVHENRLSEIQQGRVNDWCRVLREHAVRLAKFHWPAERVDRAGIAIKAAGISPGQAQLYKEVLLKLLDAETMLDKGEAVPVRKRIDALGMAEDLGISLRPLDEAQEEWDQERAEAEAKAAAIADGQGDPKITEDDERAIADELARTGITEE